MDDNWKISQDEFGPVANREKDTVLDMVVKIECDAIDGLRFVYLMDGAGRFVVIRLADLLDFAELATPR